MDREQINADIRELIERARQHHLKGQHSLSLQCYQKAIEFASQAPAWMPILFARAGGEHRDCDNYFHAIDLMLAALQLVPDEEAAWPLRAEIKKLLAITFKDVYG